MRRKIHHKKKNSSEECWVSVLSQMYRSGSLYEHNKIDRTLNMQLLLLNTFFHRRRERKYTENKIKIIML